MMDAALIALVKLLVSLRYKVELVGAEKVLAKGKEKILILPNHPALIDPIVLATWLANNVRPIFLADSQQIDRPIVRNLAHYYGVRPLPDVKELGAAARAEAEAALDECAAFLNAGKNVALYPSGHLYRSRYEDLRGNSAVEKLKRSVPGLRIVGVRMRGFWGSSFGWADGSEPHVGRALKQGIRGLLSSFVFFAPKRRITIELRELNELESVTERAPLNAALEAYYNEDAPPRTYVPYSLWEVGGERQLPEPVFERSGADASTVPEATRKTVLAHLTSLTGHKELKDDAELSRDLGMDSLARTELVAWIGKEFGIEVSAATSLETVSDVLLAACGEAVSMLPRRLAPVPGRWSAAAHDQRIAVSPTAKNLVEAFLDMVEQRGFGAPLIADQNSGVRTAGDVLTGAVALSRRFAKFEGDYVAVFLPASVAATVTYLAIHLAGKTPVMVNWTVGARNVEHALAKLDIKAIVSSKQLLAKLGERGLDFSSLSERIHALEDIAPTLGTVEKLKALLTARFGRAGLRKLPIREEAVVLFTSGSEALPKAVPLTHANVLTNLRDVLSLIDVTGRDCLLGMLPPFHSFGLTVGVGLALAAGVRVAYYADPTDAGMLARLIEAYGSTLLVGTPTFVAGIVRAGSAEQLRSVRIAVTGAEACPPRVYEAIAARCPNAIILEGYGITECSPVVSVNLPEKRQAGTIGIALPSVTTAVVDLAMEARVPVGTQGLLLVSGPSIFPGYLRHDGPAPFVKFEGKDWYNTGDLVSVDDAGVITFRGRLKRFVKIAGEMVSLPAVEAVLEPLFPADEKKPGPVHAVIADGGAERPELVLVSSRAIEQTAVNDRIREGGLSALHSVRRVLTVDSIPVLGTGKTDYQSLQKLLAPGA